MFEMIRDHWAEVVGILTLQLQLIHQYYKLVIQSKETRMIIDQVNEKLVGAEFHKHLIDPLPHVSCSTHLAVFNDIRIELIRIHSDMRTQTENINLRIGTLDSRIFQILAIIGNISGKKFEDDKYSAKE